MCALEVSIIIINKSRNRSKHHFAFACSTSVQIIGFKSVLSRFIHLNCFLVLLKRMTVV